MGLDMYAYFVGKNRVIDDFAFKESDTMGEDFYWRKNRFLHGWMANLFYKKGGEGAFNCQPIRLEEDDLDALEEAIKKRDFRDVKGFFWGEQPYSDAMAEHDLGFVKAAKAALADGDAVYYSSWW